MFFLEASKTFEFSCIASSVWRVRLGWGLLVEEEVECAWAYGRRGEAASRHPGCRCEPLVRRHGSSTQRHDGCYGLTTRPVVMMLVLMNQELTKTQPVPRAGGSQRGRSAPRWERQDSAVFQSDRSSVDAGYSCVFFFCEMSAFITRQSRRRSPSFFSSTMKRPTMNL